MQHSPPPHRANNLLWKLLLIAAGVLLLASCSRPMASAPPASKPSVAAAPETRHWVQDRRLRRVMDEVGRHVPEWPKGVAEATESAGGRIQDEEFDRVATAAAALGRAGELIPPVETTLPMGEADRRAFDAEAQTLRDQAERLREAAASHRVGAMRQTMDALNATCISCHSRFRDFSGQIDLSLGRS